MAIVLLQPIDPNFFFAMTDKGFFLHYDWAWT
jgi:hypothetical protein